MPLYFAYGSNMDEEAMAGRCPRSVPVGPAMLLRHRIVVMAEGYASVVRDPRSTVYGLLWEVALSDVHALDAYESIATGLYRKASQPVKRIGEGVRPLQQALVYLGRGGGGGVPLPGYLDTLLACAAKLDFPKAYRAELARLAAGARKGAAAQMSRSAERAAPIRAERDAEGKVVVRPRFASPFDR
ncbi:MAG: gamma-glutamylcyclotransferase [Hyphomicrobiales bacterium]|nr:gamma-glutamylcyclotransferase [Hyphomicrobiales bacterium]